MIEFVDADIFGTCSSLYSGSHHRLSQADMLLCQGPQSISESMIRRNVALPSWQNGPLIGVL